MQQLHILIYIESLFPLRFELKTSTSLTGQTLNPTNPIREYEKQEKHKKGNEKKV